MDARRRSRARARAPRSARLVRVRSRVVGAGGAAHAARAAARAVARAAARRGARRPAAARASSSRSRRSTSCSASPARPPGAARSRAACSTRRAVRRSRCSSCSTAASPSNGRAKRTGDQRRPACSASRPCSKAARRRSTVRALDTRHHAVADDRGVPVAAVGERRDRAGHLPAAASIGAAAPGWHAVHARQIIPPALKRKMRAAGLQAGRSRAAAAIEPAARARDRGAARAAWRPSRGRSAQGRRRSARRRRAVDPVVLSGSVESSVEGAAPESGRRRRRRRHLRDARRGAVHSPREGRGHDGPGAAVHALGVSRSARRRHRSAAGHLQRPAAGDRRRRCERRSALPVRGPDRRLSTVRL